MGQSTGGRRLKENICMPPGERSRSTAMSRPHSPDSRSPSAVPVMPLLTLPRLPKLTPGKPLNPEQRRELVALQEQVQAQLVQQRALVESITQLPQFCHMSRSSSSAPDQLHQTAEIWRSWQHVVGPDPVGDTAPVEDPEEMTEADGKSVRSEIDRQNSNDDSMSISTLGTITRVYVDFFADIPPVVDKKDDLGGLLEIDELMRRGGMNGADTGEPSIQTPRPSPGVDTLDKTDKASNYPSEHSASVVSLSKHSVSNVSKKSGVVDTSSRTSSIRTWFSKAVGAANVDDETSSAVAASLASPRSSNVTRNAVAVPTAPEKLTPSPGKPMPSDAPSNKRQSGVLSTATSALEDADVSTIGTRPPGRDDRRWIEAAVRRMFKSLLPTTLDAIADAFREWRLQPCVAIVKQGSRINDGPGLCILVDGVIDVLHKPLGSETIEKMCTYDRCGQCFGELELCYDVPRGGAARKHHWATIASRTPVSLWVIQRDVLRGHLPGAAGNVPTREIYSGGALPYV